MTGMLKLSVAKLRHYIIFFSHIPAIISFSRLMSVAMGCMPAGNNIDSLAFTPVFKKAGLVSSQMKCIPFPE